MEELISNQNCVMKFLVFDDDEAGKKERRVSIVDPRQDDHPRPRTTMIKAIEVDTLQLILRWTLADIRSY